MCWYIQKASSTFIIISTFLLLNVFHGFSQQVQDFALLNVVDGKTISLSSFTSCKGVAIIFTSNKCPYDLQYRDNISRLNEAFKGSIQFLLVNSHRSPEEETDLMVKHYPTWNIPVPYLSDKEQIAMDCLGAKRSPEAFLLKRNGSSFEIVYSGAINDNPLVDADVDNKYLRNAIEQLLKGEKISVSNSRSAGCMIRKKGL